MRSRGGKRHDGNASLDKALSARVASAWRGDWGTLWRDMEVSSVRGSGMREPREKTKTKNTTVCFGCASFLA